MSRSNLHTVVLSLGAAVALLSAGCESPPRTISGSDPAAVLSANRQFFRFSEQRPGEAPIAFGEPWLIESTNSVGSDATWRIDTDDAAPSGPNVLALVSPNHDGPQTYNLCWLRRETLEFGDGRLSVSFRAVSGKRDQGGGLIWRALDRDNYYVCRANPLEGNFRVYKVVSGVRTQLGSADVAIAADTWHTITVDHVGDRIRCALDGRRMLDVRDATFTLTGGVGLWTKSDAATRFDDLSVDSQAIGRGY